MRLFFDLPPNLFFFFLFSTTLGETSIQPGILVRSGKVLYGYCTMLGIGYQFEPRLCSSNRKVTFFPSLSVSLSLSPLAFSTRNSALARIFSPLLFIHQRFIAVFTRGVSRPRVEKKKKKRKGLISDGYKAAPFLAGFGNMTNRAPVTQQKLPLQVRSEKRSIPEFLHVAAPSSLSLSFDVFVQFRGCRNRSRPNKQISNVFSKQGSLPLFLPSR